MDQKLVDIALPQGFDGTEKLPKTRRSLTNCWNAVDRLINRPGITQLSTTDKVARGQFIWNENIYQVVSGDLIKITDVSTGAFSVIGTIDSFEPIDWDVGFNTAVIIVRSATGKGYTLDKSDVLTEITDPQFVPSNSVTHINGRFVYVPFNGDPAFYSDVGAGGSIQPLNFFDAEELPDKNTVCFNFTNTLYIGGTDSIELFRNTGTDSLAFTRLQNGRIQNGYIGGILEYNQTFLFIGREKDQDVGIYAIAQGSAPKISNEAIDSILITYTTTELQNAVSSRFKWLGYDIATFTLARHSFGFLGGNWFILSTQSSNEAAPWQGGYINQYNGKYYTAYNDKIGRLDDINTDYGQTFEKTMDLAFESEGLLDFSAQSLTINISQGYNDAIGSVALQLSHDNVLYTEPFYRQTGAIGQYYSELTWNYSGGLGLYKGFMGVRITTTEKVNFSTSKLVINLR